MLSNQFIFRRITMKKMLVVLVSGFLFAFGSSGVGSAGEPVLDSLDRHAVWTKWYDSQGRRVVNPPQKDRSINGDAVNISTESRMKSGKPQFDFIKETKEYDASRDRA
jgi:hypothetical protein